jgi:hypothetical protein
MTAPSEQELKTMRPISRVFLAKLLAGEITGPHCGEVGEWWREQEAAHAAARTAEAAAEAARPALELCNGCPGRRACADWARLDKYTGLADGAVYVNGERKPPDTIIRTGTARSKAS